MTQGGVKFLKEHLGELSEDIAAFSLTEKQVMDMQLEGESK